ncbi:alpha/beta hydrolase [Plantibacter flavus]|uniref:alpha/beta hydrolase fold domain-containing protein n=1 Tax=Plantibacter flavus TaxID=150123 RepID=UPI003F173A15
MPLDPFFIQRFTEREELVARGYDAAHIHEEFTRSPDAWTPPDDVEISEVTVDHEGHSARARLYRPRGTSWSGQTRVMMLHGGGFTSGSIDWAEAHVVAAELATRRGAIVLSVDYRLSVGDSGRYPAALDDVHAAWFWLMREYDTDGAAFIGGGSAGANLAASVAMRLRDERGRTPDGMLLAYGVFHFPLPSSGPDVARALHALPSSARATPDDMISAQRNYVGRIHGVPRYAMPGHSDLSDMPPAAILISEYDDLRESSEFFARQLQDAGVPVKVRLARGMIHGHLNWHPGPTLPEVEAGIGFFADQLPATEPRE